MRHTNHDLLKAAFLNFQDAYNHLTALMIESDFTFEKDYPLQTSFEEIDIAQWVKASVRLIARHNKAQFCMDNRVWLSLTTDAKEHLLADKTIESLEDEFLITAVEPDGTGDILGKDGSTFHGINLNVLGI